MTERILRLPAVKTLTGRCRSAIYNDIKAGTFPPPIKLGARASGWLESEIAEWIAAKTADSRRCQRYPNKDA